MDGNGDLKQATGVVTPTPLPPAPAPSLPPVPLQHQVHQKRMDGVVSGLEALGAAAAADEDADEKMDLSADPSLASSDPSMANRALKRRQVLRACKACAAAHIGCSVSRPCLHCMSHDIECEERPSKRARTNSAGMKNNATGSKGSDSPFSLYPMSLMPPAQPMPTWTLPPSFTSPMLPSVFAVPEKSAFARPMMRNPQEFPMEQQQALRPAVGVDTELSVKLRFEPPYTQNYGDVTITLPSCSLANDLVRQIRDMCQLGPNQPLLLVAYVKDTKVIMDFESPIAQYITSPGMPLFVSLFIGFVFATVTTNDAPATHSNVQASSQSSIGPMSTPPMTPTLQPQMPSFPQYPHQQMSSQQMQNQMMQQQMAMAQHQHNMSSMVLPPIFAPLR